MDEDIRFLMELKQELNTQDHDVQAAPRFWVVGDYKMVCCPEGCEETYYVSAPNQEYFGDMDELLKSIKEDELEDMPEDAQEEFAEIACEISAIEWIKKHYDKEAEYHPMEEVHIVHPNTMFLTKAEAKKHIELNYYHYSHKAHTYAMTAWRAPKVEQLIKILETFDWDGVNSEIEMYKSALKYIMESEYASTAIKAVAYSALQGKFDC